jgi:hypothetical protein
MIFNVTLGRLSQSPLASVVRSSPILYNTVHENGYKHEPAGPFLCGDKGDHVVLPKALAISPSLILLSIPMHYPMYFPSIMFVSF